VSESVFVCILLHEQPRIAADHAGRVIAFATSTVAEAFAERCGQHGIPAAPIERTATDIADLLLAAGVTDPDEAEDRVAHVETEALDADDALRYAAFLADEVAK